MKSLFKRITACIMMATMFLSISVTASADTSSISKNYEVTDWSESSSFDFNSYINSAKIKPQTRSRSLTVQHFFQDGRTWSGDYLTGNVYTIGQAGCLVTCISMYQVYMGGAQNPRAVNNYLKDNSVDTSSIALDNVADLYNYTTELKITPYDTMPTLSQTRLLIKYEIDSGRPVIIGLKKKNPSTGQLNTHFVLAYGYETTYAATIKIHDPLLSNNYTSLDQYLNTYDINVLRSFS